MNPRLASHRHKSDPWPLYRRLRLHQPVRTFTISARRHAWIITRYQHAVTALKDPRLAKDPLHARGRQPWTPPFLRPLTRNMLDLDEPHHARLRSLVNKAFTSSRVNLLIPRIQCLAEELLEPLPARRRFDLLRDYALPIPTTIIAEMLGIPSDDHHRFVRWTQLIVSADASGWRMLLALPAVASFLRYIRRLVRERQAEPRDDLISALVQAEEAGERLNEDELFAMVFLLLVAGHETTVNLIGNGMLALLEHPEQMQRLCDDPSLIVSAVEELLRYAGPLELATERFAREDLVIGGTTIPRGATVYVALASANRDEEHFHHPDELDLGRSPNRHLSFGLGPHYCLGAPLARLEAQIAINTLLRDIPRLDLAVDRQALRWRRSLVLRGLHSLPVRINRGDTR